MTAKSYFSLATLVSHDKKLFIVFLPCYMSEIETLTGEDTTERVEMALGQPITSGEQSPERTLQERKLQNNVIIAPY